MIDWTKPMKQTFEYYIVDPGTWRESRPIKNVKSCTVVRDSEAETLGSATIDVDESLGECYIRAYLLATQNEVTDKRCLGTFLVQTPSSAFDGRIKTTSITAYTPLLELKENPPPLGYSVLKNEPIMDSAYKIVREQVRAPVVKPSNAETLYGNFVSNTDDKWITFISDLIANAKYKLALDEYSRVLFSPEQKLASLQPVWTYKDDNSSILHPDISIDRDFYGIPNVVEVVYSNDGETIRARVVNDDPNSPTSTVSRGREITHRDTNPSISGIPTEGQIKEYATKLLKELSVLQCTVSYTHGYCPVRLDDCVRLNCPSAGLNDVKARVTYQSINCEPGCPVTEKAVFPIEFWEASSQ